MTETEWLDIFSNNLIDVLNEQGYSQEELAYETNLSQSTISKYINKKQMPSLKAIINIAYTLDCSIDELIDFGEKIL